MTQNDNNKTNILPSSLNSTTLDSNSAKDKVFKSILPTYNKNNTDMFKSNLTSNTLNFNSVLNTKALTSILQIIS